MHPCHCSECQSQLSVTSNTVNLTCFSTFACALSAWRRVVKLSAVDCAATKNEPLCREHHVASYPTLKVICISINYKFMPRDYKASNALYMLADWMNELSEWVHACVRACVHAWMNEWMSEWTGRRSETACVRQVNFLQLLYRVGEGDGAPLKLSLYLELFSK